ncbi:MAG: efflux RND transporter periplasmic adaptor subunit [Chromatocurvus sp.]
MYSNNSSLMCTYLTCPVLAICLWMGSTLAIAADREVSVIAPEPVSIRDALALSGTVTARRQAMLSPRMDGLVGELRVDAGARVEQDTVLLRLDTALIERELALARASTEEARAAAEEATRLVDEAERLRDDNFIPATELASREAAKAATAAALGAAQAEEQLIAEQRRRHDLPAPFTGVIAERMTETGEWIKRGDPVFRLVATDAVWIDVNVPQEHFSRLSIGTPARILPDSTRDTALDGRIVALVPVSNVEARSFLVRIAADDPSGALFPGTSVTAEILADADNRGLSLPREAVLVHPDGGRSVFVIDADNRARRHRVEVAEASARSVVIRDGLPSGARIALRGNQLLRDGDHVAIVDDAGRR